PGSMTHERLPLPHVSRRRNETCFDAPTRGTRHATHLCWFLDAPDSRSLAQQRGWPPIVKRTSPGSGRQTPAARGESSTDETQFFQPLVEHNSDAIGLVSAGATFSHRGGARGPATPWLPRSRADWSSGGRRYCAGRPSPWRGARSVSGRPTHAIDYISWPPAPRRKLPLA